MHRMAYETTDIAAPDVESLPREVRALGRDLITALQNGVQVRETFSAFCSAAYVKPDWAGPASEFLAALFEEKEDILSEMARIPDLIIELASGHYTLTFMVASRWLLKGDTARLVRLAEALIATQARMSGGEIVDVMLALATSLAVTRFPRAEQLLIVAEPQATEDHREALQEARLWLGAGRIVRGCTPEVRDLLDHRLRRSRNTWAWESREEREALTQLADHLDVDMEGAALFKAITPTVWWDLAMVRARERTEHEATEAPPSPEPAPEPPLPGLDVSMLDDRTPIVVWNAFPFFCGGLVGAAAMAGVIWLGPYDLIKGSPKLTSAPVTVPSTLAIAATKPKTSASTTTTTPTAIAPAVAVSPAAAPSPAIVPVAQEQTMAQWRQQESAALAKESPELARLVDRIKVANWTLNEALLKGEMLELTRDNPDYQTLLLWLHLDPPQDADTRSRIPGLLAAVRQDTILLDLWEKLVYPGSPNAADIQIAAKKQHHDNAGAWSPAQRAQLSRIGWESPTTTGP